MEEHEAVFEIDSKTDAFAVERAMDSLFDTLREESRTFGEATADSSDMLAQFEAIREATKRRTPGRLRVVYEPKDGEFEG